MIKWLRIMVTKKPKKPIESEYNLGDIAAGYFDDEVQVYKARLKRYNFFIKTGRI